MKKVKIETFVMVRGKPIDFLKVAFPFGPVVIHRTLHVRIFLRRDIYRLFFGKIVFL